MRETPAIEPDSPPSPFWSATTAWVFILLACFAAQQVVVVHMGKPYDAYLALSGYGIKSWHLWELLTCNLLHLGWAHLAFNLTGLWFLGRVVEGRVGWKRLAGFCFAASLAGAALQGGVAASGFLLPESMESLASFLRDRFGGPLYGASIPLCALLVAFCRTEASGAVRLPGGAQLGVHRLLWPALGVAALLVVVPSNPDLPHLAHLGAMLAALLMAPRLKPARRT